MTPKYAVNDILTMNKPTDHDTYTVIVREVFEYEGEYWYSVAMKDALPFAQHITRDCQERYLTKE